MTKRDRLGRGLDALLKDYLVTDPDPESPASVRVSAISPNPMQPRRDFPAEELSELAESIRDNGLLQPLVVRPRPGHPGRFELVAGERRLRAVRSLGWEDVPVVLREASDDTLLVLALVENLQREALNPVEEAEGYQALADQFGLSQEEIAKAVGKNRATVANCLRLLKSPPSIKRMLREGALSMGHARALLSVADPAKASKLARAAVAEGWSVREVERRARSKLSAGRQSSPRPTVEPMFRVVEDALAEHISTRVSITRYRSGKGVIRLAYDDVRELERIFELVTGRSVESLAD